MAFWSTYQSGTPGKNYVFGSPSSAGSQAAGGLGPNLSAAGGSTTFNESNGQNSVPLGAGGPAPMNPPQTGGLEPNPNRSVPLGAGGPAPRTSPVDPTKTSIPGKSGQYGGINPGGTMYPENGGIPPTDPPETGGMEPNPYGGRAPTGRVGGPYGGINPGGMYSNRNRLNDFWRSARQASTPNLYSSSAKQAFAQTARANARREMTDFARGYYNQRPNGYGQQQPSNWVPLGAGGPAPRGVAIQTPPNVYSQDPYQTDAAY